ncbi:hypothetical protein D3C86_1961770 [compost metagenome]
MQAGAVQVLDEVDAQAIGATRARRIEEQGDAVHLDGDIVLGAGLEQQFMDEMRVDLQS